MYLGSYDVRPGNESSHVVHAANKSGSAYVDCRQGVKSVLFRVHMIHGIPGSGCSRGGQSAATTGDAAPFNPWSYG